MSWGTVEAPAIGAMLDMMMPQASYALLCRSGDHGGSTWWVNLMVMIKGTTLG